MPSGAKKRKAAKKKLQKETHNSTNNNYGSHSKGNDNGKSHDERESDGGEGERESFKEVRNVQEFSSEGKGNTGESYNDVMVNTEDDGRESKNGQHENSSSSSSSSSSDDEEVAVEKEKPVVAEASGENPVISEVVCDSVEESIPVEESVKQVVSLPQEPDVGSESAAVKNSMISHVVESGLKQNCDEVLPSADEKDKVSSGVTEFLQEEIETKVIQVKEEVPGNLSGSVDIAARDGDGLLPPSSGVIPADACYEDNHVKESETHKYVEEQPLVSSAPLPVRRTSWMNCCGLFEAFSGAASR